ncbi:MAG: hypothetical protein LBU65_01715 [Planctomycetaceae bacterium]|jgi:transposase-like protein|nr:hypothetical protein [Planctomycetaceae bacterium]
MNCKYCHSEHFHKSGFTRDKQRYECKDCGRYFVVGDDRVSDKIIGTKALCVVLYSLAKASYSMLGKVFDHNRSLIYRWIREAGLTTPEPEISENIQEIEFDEMWHFIKKDDKLWVIKAFDHCSRRTVGWTLGGRQKTTRLQRSGDCTAKWNT